MPLNQGRDLFLKPFHFIGGCRLNANTEWLVELVDNHRHHFAFGNLNNARSIVAK